jgi:hypothetical protein
MGAGTTTAARVETGNKSSIPTGPFMVSTSSGLVRIMSSSAAMQGITVKRTRTVRLNTPQAILGDRLPSLVVLQLDTLIRSPPFCCFHSFLNLVRLIYKRRGCMSSEK